jgi:hemoglobin-like flavoprotein
MNSRQIELVRTSFAQIKPITEETAVLFYARLFELNPELRKLFTIDIREQGHKLMDILGFAIAGLDRVDELKPALDALGQRHVGYGVQDSHYDTVGAALLWTLEQALKSDYTSEMHEAWTAVYTFISETMKGAERLPAEAAAVV